MLPSAVRLSMRGGLDERPAAVRRAVVAEPLVAGRHGQQRVAPDRGLGVGHGQRCRDAFGHERLDRTPGHGLEGQADELVAVVGVEEVLARPAGQLGLAQRPQRVARLGAELGAHRQPRRVAEQVVQRDRGVARAHREPGDVVGDRCLQVDAAGLVLLQEHRGRERLADRADLKARVGCDRLAGRHARQTLTDEAQRALAVGQPDRHAGSGEARQTRRDELVDGRQRGHQTVGPGRVGDGHGAHCVRVGDPGEGTARGRRSRRRPLSHYHRKS